MSKELADREVSDWWEAAMRLGEQLGSDGPRGYYELTPTQWLKWAESELPIAALRSEPVGEIESDGGMVGVKFTNIDWMLSAIDGTKIYAAPSRESRTDRQEPGLSAEQIEHERESYKNGYGVNDARFYTLCDMALRSLTARNEGIEAAAIANWNAAMDYCIKNKINPSERNELFIGCAAIRALKGGK